MSTIAALCTVDAIQTSFSQSVFCIFVAMSVLLSCYGQSTCGFVRYMWLMQLCLIFTVRCLQLQLVFMHVVLHVIYCCVLLKNLLFSFAFIVFYTILYHVMYY